MKALRFKPKYKVYYRYQNIKLWRKLNLMNLHHKKWTSLKLIEQQYANTKNLRIIRPIYLCHSRKLNVERLYFYKFLNKQILRNYLVNYNEFSFSQILRTNYLKFECRLDFNLYKAGFVEKIIPEPEVYTLDSIINVFDNLEENISVFYKKALFLCAFR